MTQNCRQLLTCGSCTDPACIYSHNIQVCEPCNFVASSLAMYQSHMQGKKHRNRVAGRNTLLHCAVCERNIFAYSWDAHVSGKRHRRAASQQQVVPQVMPEAVVDDIPGKFYCDLCQLHISNNIQAIHSRSPQHQSKERYAAFKAVLDEAEKDKNGVTISGELDFDIVDPLDARDGVTCSASIKTIIPTSKIMLVEMKLASAKGVAVTSPFSVVLDSPYRTVTFGKPILFKVTFRQNYIGRCEDRLEVVFEDVQLRKRFVIARALRAIVGSKADHELLRPKAPYVPRKSTTRQPETEVVGGERPPALEAIPYVVALPHAKIPGPLSSVLSTGSFSEIISRIRRVFLPSVLDSETYGRHFKGLLWIEEFRMDRDLERYDIPDAKMTTHQGYYYFLGVPGLAEKRPSVLVGDSILIQKHGAKEGHWFEGRVHVVRRDEVGLRFHASFRGWSRDQLYNVHFKLNRYPLRRQHQAMDTAFSQDRVLFPLQDHLPGRVYPTRTEARLQVFNPLIATNPPQLQAVVSIVKQVPGAVPFIIFGPPGTGKTVTMVEAIRQVLRHNPNARVLACAPSNSAADLIASRLTALSTDQLFRFYAPSRDKRQVPDDLMPYTYVRNDGHFSIPLLARMKRFRVIVTTCVSASFASGIGIPRGHYSHIFVDEAGQATEPEAMIAIKTMADNSTNVVLSGDPKQLGPIIRSSIARELGLEKSLIERLMAREIYDEQKGYGTAVVKLIKNFRSHNAILKFPNDQFYKSELQQCADPRVINSYLDSSYLPSKQFPVVFHAISGRDAREASSPSFFNVDEVTQVKNYIQALRADRRFRTTDNDIGVITPYHAQCGKIRAVLRAVADGVKIGSVEEFQGQERRVIIISTVRSSREFVEYDLRHTLGFVANPRRFNVAVTRAQALLIIIGDPLVLSLDPLWRSFLNYVYINGGWMGPQITWDPHAPVEEAGGYDRRVRETAKGDMNEFTRRMEELTLAGVDSTGEDDQEVDANVDRPWRDVE